MKKTLWRLGIIAALGAVLALCPACAQSLESGGASASAQTATPEEASLSQEVQSALESAQESASAAAEMGTQSTSASSDPGPEESASLQSVSSEPDPDWLLAEHIYSHRGASGYEVEHTFAAYDLAIEQGSHCIEQDLVTSRDGTLYVSHDDSASRIAGVDRNYAKMTDEDISGLRTANGEHIHSLAEVFDRYGTAVTYLVELKEGKSQAGALARLVREKGMENNVIVQSFFPEALLALEEEYPDMPKLWLCRDQESVNRAVKEPSADIVCVKGNLMTKKNCKKVHRKGKKFCVYWTDGEEVKKAIQMGVDCYFTNYTDRALALEREWREA